MFPDKITKKELNYIKNLLSQQNTIEVILKQTKTTLEEQGLYAIKLEGINQKEEFIKIAYNIPGITVIDVNGVLLFVRRDRTDELKKLLIQLIKIYDVDTIIRIFNEVGVILDNRDKDYLKQITHYVVENNILFKFTKALFSLNERETHIIKLLAIEIYYMSENYTRGDGLFVSMPFSKKHDEELLSFRSYIKVNRDTYKNTRGFSKRLVRIRKQSNE